MEGIIEKKSYEHCDYESVDKYSSLYLKIYQEKVSGSDGLIHKAAPSVGTFIRKHKIFRNCALNLIETQSEHLPLYKVS